MISPPLSNTKALAEISKLKSNVGRGTKIYAMENLDKNDFQKLKDDNKNLPMFIVIAGR